MATLSATIAVLPRTCNIGALADSLSSYGLCVVQEDRANMALTLLNSRPQVARAMALCGYKAADYSLV